MKIKICCIGDATEARLASESGADFFGLVGPMPSGPGVVTLDQAQEIATAPSLSARPILLTAAESAEAILTEAAFVGVTVVQVVRHIASEEAARLRESDIEYVQVIHVAGPESLALIDDYAAHCDAFLLDSGTPTQNTFGGTGLTHDWSVSADFVARAGKPVFLAGGLNRGNVGRAIRQVRPFGVDICSGLRPHRTLDPALLSAFMEEVRLASA